MRNEYYRLRDGKSYEEAKEFDETFRNACKDAGIEL